MKQNTFLNYVLNIVPLLLVGWALVYAAAPAGWYLPWATNDPDCAPWATDCFVKVISTVWAVPGQIISALKSSDFDGWIKLDGRAKSTLTSTQQAQATALGIGVNLPDATNAYLSQNGSSLWSVWWSNTKTIVQNQLPNVTLNGTTASAWDHTHTHNALGTAWNYGLIYESNGGSNTTDGNNDTTVGEPNLVNSPAALVINTAGAHTHTFTTSSLNGGVTQQVLNVQPQTMSVNMFIYLWQ